MWVLGFLLASVCFTCIHDSRADCSFDFSLVFRGIEICWIFVINIFILLFKDNIFMKIFPIIFKYSYRGHRHRHPTSTSTNANNPLLLSKTNNATTTTATTISPQPASSRQPPPTTGVSIGRSIDLRKIASLRSLIL